MMNLLSGLRITDLSMFVAGPFATATLAELGAEVIKVEPLTGDPVRTNRIGPSIGDESAQFQTYNVGKTSIAIDLKSEAGRRVVRDLAARSEVVFDNFRPGVMGRLGLDHDTLCRGNPALVSVSLSGFGASGPWAKRPGYDLIVQALGGGLSLCGHQDAGGPAHIPFHLGDTAGGLYAAIAILAAVRDAERTGKGRAFEVSMLDAQLHLLGDEITFAATGNWQNEPHGSGHPALAPYAVYQTLDDPIVVAAVGTEKFWKNLLTVVDLPGLASDPRFADAAGRAEHRRALDRTLQAKFATRASAAWLAALQAADVPAAAVHDVEAAITSEHAIARDVVVDVRTAGGGTATVPRVPIRPLGDAHPPALAPAPALGADLRPVLGAVLGYDDQEIRRLVETGIVGPG